MDIRIEIEKLLRYGVKKQLLEQEDVIYARNALLELLHIPEPIEQLNDELVNEVTDSAVPILNRLLDYAAEQGILTDNHTTARDLLDAKMMGLLMPRPSETIRKFMDTLSKSGPEQALTNFYELCKASNYIRMDRIQKNVYWQTETQCGHLEITINLSKPEKDPKEIAALKDAPQRHYPKCLLCADNVGYAGRLDHPARQNLRILPLTLNGERWYFQYSPYVYYNEHCIIFNEQHVPMKISEQTFARLLDFVDQFPHYFIGSNADLPIVGGSILNHDHFQGGHHTFAMQKASAQKQYRHPSFANVTAAKVDWPLSVIRLESSETKPLVEAASDVLSHWRQYSDPAAELIANSVSDDGNRIPHNTITPIAWRNENGRFVLDLVLRNNRMNEEHPEGIFHPHRELHHIKKENIGLIEVMGLAVLPGRLKDELEQIAGLLVSSEQEAKLAAIREDQAHPLHKHADWIETLIGNVQAHADRNEAVSWLQQEVGKKFYDVLTHAGIFKHDAQGQEAFDRWMAYAGFQLDE